MSGTLFGIGLSQQHDSNGQPLVGCKLYLYAANTSTPVTAYADTALTVGQELSNPLIADANGRIPAFWLADGSYRARLTTSAGIVQFDELSVLALGASSGAGVADSTDVNSIFVTGMPIWMPIIGSKAGWVRMNGRTIGSATSGAAERANADVQSLFEYAWDNYSDTLCPVTGGRGASSAADWAANKKIATLDMRGRSAFGTDDMGNTGAGILTLGFLGIDVTAVGPIGAQGIDLLQSDLPNINQSGVTSIAASTISGTYTTNSTPNIGAPGSGTSNFIMSAGGPSTQTFPVTFGAVTTAVRINGNQAQTALNKMPPTMLGSWYWKL